MTFSDLGLSPRLLQALAEEGYTVPTPIQAQAIPYALAGRDLLGIAQTGTGKTAAFGLPLLHRLAAQGGRPPRGGCRALILSPTRELASQIADSLKAYGRHLGLSVATVFGGVPHGPQRRALAAGIDVLVATPGRLQDHMDEGTARLDHVSTLVLDEADQMLDKGFWPAIRRILPKLPQPRHTMFFSATMPAEVAKLASEILKDPARVEVTPVASTAERVTQRLIFVEQGRNERAPYTPPAVVRRHVQPLQFHRAATVRPLGDTSRRLALRTRDQETAIGRTERPGQTRKFGL
jgi:ATP-dependent RNA helicase RhlE